MKIGILGGSFDPVHNGHLLLAQETLDILGLEKVLFVPACHQYTKNSTTPFNDRCAMLFQAVQGNPKFSVEIINDDGNTYTYNTLVELHKRYPDGEFHFIAGSDIITQIRAWHKAEELGKLCSFVFVHRDDNEFSDIFSVSRDLHFSYSVLNDAISLPISSSLIRKRIQRKKSCRYLVPDGILDYIYRSHLYEDTL